MKCVQCRKKTCVNHHRLCDKCWGLREKELNKMEKKELLKDWRERRTRKEMINIIKLKVEEKWKMKQ